MKTIFTEKVKHKEVGELKPVEETNTFATYDHKCSKCGHNKAQLIECGAWYGDEDKVIRFKCGKCGHTVNLEGKIK